MAILSKAGSPHVGLVLRWRLAWHSGPCSLGLIQLSHDGLLAPQHQISGSGGGLGEEAGCFTECPASFKSTPVFSRAFPKHLRLPVSTLCPQALWKLSLVCSEVLKLLGEDLKGLKHASGRCPVSSHQLCGPALSQKIPHVSRVVFLTAR